MPRQDKTGPLGQGSMTGRGFGICKGNAGNGFRCGFNRGMGFRRSVILTKDDEKNTLEAELKELDLRKQEIEKKLKNLE